MHSFVIRTLALLPLALFFSCASAEDKAVLHESGYLEESPLPKGYPMPGPFNKISKKTYPAYRAAVTPTNGPQPRLLDSLSSPQASGHRDDLTG